MFEQDVSISADMLAPCSPDAALARLLDDTDVDGLDDDALVEVVAAWRRVESWAAARAAQVAAALSERASMNPRWPAAAGSVREPCVAGEEIALRLGCSRRSARELIRAGKAYAGALWPTGEALESGMIDERKARLLVTMLTAVPGQVALAVQEEVLPRAPRRTHSDLAADIQRALIRVDPDEAAERTARATADRRVCRPKVLPDGLAGIWAVLPAPAAVAVHAELDAVARRVRGLGDGRTIDQLRADALSAAILARPQYRALRAGSGGAQSDASGGAPTFGGTTAVSSSSTPAGATSTMSGTPTLGGATPTMSGARAEGAAHGLPTGPDDRSGNAAKVAGSPAGAGMPGGADVLSDVLSGPPLAANIQVTVPLDVLTGRADGAAELAGYGAVSGATAEALARGGTWRRLVTDPLTGVVLDVGRTRYRPPPDLDRHVRVRDGTCVRPGCPTSAWSCDLDHTIPFGDIDSAQTGGTTSADNLGALCRRDHLLKTHGGFHLRQVAPGVFEWTTPTGRRYLDG